MDKFAGFLNYMAFIYNLNVEDVFEKFNSYVKEESSTLKEGGIDRILLDNFTIQNTKKAIKIIGEQCKIESSGGINESNILKYAKCGVDFISVGAITHSVSNFDLSLKAY